MTLKLEQNLHNYRKKTYLIFKHLLHFPFIKLFHVISRIWLPHQRYLIVKSRNIENFKYLMPYNVLLYLILFYKIKLCVPTPIFKIKNTYSKGRIIRGSILDVCQFYLPRRWGSSSSRAESKSCGGSYWCRLCRTPHYCNSLWGGPIDASWWSLF